MKGYLKDNAFVVTASLKKRSTSRGTATKLKPQKAATPFKVCVRVRPLLQKEKQQTPRHPRGSNSIVSRVSERHLYLLDSDEQQSKQFTFDHVFNEHNSNQEVYSILLAPALTQVKLGFNVTCFAYGMTGAGKTHTMFGNSAERGIADLCVSELQGSKLTASFLEIYNETVRDLLSNTERALNI
jgi:chromosomal replication initiation ATPase DnaA